MFKDLIEYEGIGEACGELFGFSNVTMLRDFGPLKKGDKVDTIWFDLENGECEACLEDGTTITHRFPFKLAV